MSQTVKPGETVQPISAVDFDCGEKATISYAVILDNDDKLFQINSATTTAKVSRALGYDTL